MMTLYRRIAMDMRSALFHAHSWSKNQHIAHDKSLYLTMRPSLPAGSRGWESLPHVLYDNAGKAMPILR